MPTLRFKGKTFFQNHLLAASYRQLVPYKKKSLTFNIILLDNLIIHGDNLKAPQDRPWRVNKINGIFGENSGK